MFTQIPDGLKMLLRGTLLMEDGAQRLAWDGTEDPEGYRAAAEELVKDMPGIRSNPFLRELIEEKLRTPEQRRPSPFLEDFSVEDGGQDLDQNGLDCVEQLRELPLQSRWNQRWEFVSNVYDVIRALNWDNPEAQAAVEK